MSRARELSKLGNLNVLSADDVSNEVGIASTVPRSTLDVRGELQVGTGIQVGPAGVITASSFDGALGGNIVAAACTFTTGTFNGNVTIGGTLTYEDVTNVDALGIVTARAGVNVSGGQIQVGAAFSVGNAGVATAAGFVGPLTGAVTGNATGLTGTPNISCGTIAGSTGTFTGDVDIADKIVHTGDTNTALRFPGADTITAETGGSERVRITSAGFVGVNETTPACQLHVEQDVAHASTFWLNSDAGIMIDNKNSTANTPKRVLKLEGDGAIVYGSSDTGDLLFNQRENTVLTLGESRHVGIGTTNPSSLLTLNNDSSVYITLKRANANHLQVGTDNNGHYIVGREDKPIIFANSASSAYTERLRITSGGLVGLGTTNPQNALHVESASNTYVQISKPDTASNVLVGNANGDCIIESTGGQVKIKPNGSSNKFILDTSGRLLLGQSSADADIGSHLQVVGASYGAAGILQSRISADQYGPALDFLKTRNTSWGSHTIVQDGDQLGRIYFRGDDGADYGNAAASIFGEVDGTPGSNDMPGRLVFHTSGDGTVSVTERLRITSTGAFQFSNGALTEKVNITAGKLSDNTNIDLADGMVHYFTTQESTTCTPNIRVSSAVSLNDIMTAGDVVTVTLVTTAAAGGYSAQVTIDGNSVTEEWVGGEAPSAGGDDGLDIYVYTIICIHASNTGDSGFKVIANKVNATN